MAAESRNVCVDIPVGNQNAVHEPVRSIEGMETPERQLESETVASTLHDVRAKQGRTISALKAKGIFKG